MTVAPAAHSLGSTAMVARTSASLMLPNTPASSTK
jgi:hypothetical protein